MEISILMFSTHTFKLYLSPWAQPSQDTGHPVGIFNLNVLVLWELIRQAFPSCGLIETKSLLLPLKVTFQLRYCVSKFIFIFLLF
jgi:hypothetical protein